MEAQESKNINEIQILEHSLQQILMQKQAFELELNETRSALEELNSAGDEVYKIIGQLLIKSSKSKIEEELKNKFRFLEIKVKSFEKQESHINEKLDNFKDELNKSLNKG
jgi:prefoldin beta subunit